MTVTGTWKDYFPEPERGKIRNEEHASQLNDFSGLRWGNITPTDIDGMVDFGDIAFVYFDTKKEGAEMPFGQRLALQRNASAVAESGRRSIAFIAMHDTDGVIDTANCLVTEYWWNGQWYADPRRLTLRSAIDSFLANHPSTSHYINGNG